jgi:hypothetical protein
MWGVDVLDHGSETKSELNRSHSEIADIEILNRNIVKCIEVVKIS